MNKPLLILIAACSFVKIIAQDKSELAEINRELDKCPELDVLGWYHSHPRIGIFLSRADIFIHREFFNHPNQVALVVDPYTMKKGFYGWYGEEIIKYPCNIVNLK